MSLLVSIANQRYCLYIGDLDAEVNTFILKNYFSKFGNIENAIVYSSKTY